MKMKLTNLTRWTLVAVLFSVSAHLCAEDCLSGLPDSLRSAVERDHWKILSPFDIPSNDWKLWKNTHQGQCPGVAVGNFFPKTDSSFVVALIQGEDPKNLLEKVVLLTRKKGQPVTEIIVNPVQAASLSLVWKLPPGHYAGVDGKRAAISRDSFVIEKIASSATQFYYQGTKLQSFIISN
ncbi:MAG: hypothetical protein QOJ51_4280 [Acidobacteriaceae bacterium]|nr:hypothetical protein [Acidobacteriaceae bacterium]